MNVIEQALTDLHEIRCQLDVLAIDKQEAIDAVLTPEVKRALADIDYEFDTVAQAAQGQAQDLEKDIKAMVLEQGETVKVPGKLQATWNKPRMSWDTKGLEGYALNAPEILYFRKEGKPTVSIRVAK